jgi:hypothetical protein
MPLRAASLLDYPPRYFLPSRISVNQTSNRFDEPVVALCSKGANQGVRAMAANDNVERATAPSALAPPSKETRRAAVNISATPASGQLSQARLLCRRLAGFGLYFVVKGVPNVGVWAFVLAFIVNRPLTSAVCLSVGVFLWDLIRSKIPERVDTPDRNESVYFDDTIGIARKWHDVRTDGATVAALIVKAAVLSVAGIWER